MPEEIAAGKVKTEPKEEEHKMEREMEIERSKTRVERREKMRISARGANKV